MNKFIAVSLTVVVGTVINAMLHIHLPVVALVGLSASLALGIAHLRGQAAS